METTLTIRDFLVKRDETGRFVVFSNKTGKTYYIEAIGNRPSTWGDLNPATGKIEGSYGEKNRGSIDKQDSLIEKYKEQFAVIHDLEVGQDPLSYIEKLEEKNV